MHSQAANSNDRTQAIIGASVQNMSNNVKAYLPSIETMKRGIRRMRSGNNLPEPRVDDLGFAMPQEYSVLANGEQFIQYGNGNNERRLLIFGTAAGIAFLTNSDDWFMDGTFTVAPPQFAQLYTIHGLRNGHHVVRCYALLPNKQEATY